MPLIVEVVVVSADNKNAVIVLVGVDTRDEHIKYDNRSDTTSLS